MGSSGSQYNIRNFGEQLNRLEGLESAVKDIRDIEQSENKYDIGNFDKLLKLKTKKIKTINSNSFMLNSKGILKSIKGKKRIVSLMKLTHLNPNFLFEIISFIKTNKNIRIVTTRIYALILTDNILLLRNYFLI